MNSLLRGGLLGAIAVSFLSLPLQAQSSPKTGASPLQGLRNLEVVVEDTPEARAAGIDTTGLRVQVELALRQAGLTVFDGAPEFVYLNLNLLEVSRGQWAYSYRLELKEVVRQMRRPADDFMVATTWSRGGVGVVGRNNMPQAIRDAVRGLTDVFLNDWLAANPPAR